MRKKIFKILGIILIIIGVTICMCVLISRIISNVSIRNAIEDFVEDANSENGYSELYQYFQEYNEDLYANGQELVDAFSYENPDFDLTKYGFSENVVGYIDIPKMDVTLPIYLGASKENLYKGATLLSQTSIPIGGENTNSVIAAHRGLIRNSMFRNIQLLEIGDELTITNFWYEITYKVCEIKIIQPQDINQILIQEGRDLVTLITCHPYRVNTQRYMVICERVEE